MDPVAWVESAGVSNTRYWQGTTQPCFGTPAATQLHSLSLYMVRGKYLAISSRSAGSPGASV
jgi:hypothetical protein